MMAAQRTSTGLIGRLPAVRGRYSADADLSRVTWFRVGGPAEVMFRPADADDLAARVADGGAELAAPPARTAPISGISNCTNWSDIAGNYSLNCRAPSWSSLQIT